MNIQELNATCERLYHRLEEDGYSAAVISTNKWILGHFQKYCAHRGLEEIGVADAARFLKEQYDIDYRSVSCAQQTVLRRPLLILFEFHATGNYCKTHQRGSTTEIPQVYSGLYLRHHDFVNRQRLCLGTKQVKIWVFTLYLSHLAGKGITEPSQWRPSHVHEYMATLGGVAFETRRRFASALRETLDWLYGEHAIGFSGRQVFPLIRKAPNNRILSYYTQDEIDRMFSAIDIGSPTGRRDMLIVSLAAVLGLRAGDIINLRFENIDWGNNAINIVQRKTGRPLTLPLVDAVKLPLIDYLKNGRHESRDNDYILVTAYAPYTRYMGTAPLCEAITRCMDKAGINIDGRHHGPHALRHSLATNLMRNNAPISAISNVLGHASTRTTELYLTVDERNLQKLALEVPDED